MGYSCMALHSKPPYTYISLAMDSPHLLRSYLDQQFDALGFDQKLIFLALLLSSSFLLLIKYATTGGPKRAGRRTRLPPGPPGLPLIGNLHQAGKALHHDFWEVAKVYGPLFYFRAGCKPAVVVSSADAAREVLKIKDLATCSRPRLATAVKHTYGYLNLAFSPYNDYWRQMRRLLMSELFATKKVLSMRSVREDEVGAFVDAINGGSGSNTIDLSEMFFNLLNNLTVGTVFGKRYVKGWNGGRNSSLELVIEALELVVTFSMADWIPWLGWVDKLRGIPEKIDRSFRRMDAFFEEVIETHLNDRAKNNNDGQQEHNDLTDVMLDIGQKLSIPLNKNHIKGILLDLFIAGTDTTSTALEWAMTELVRHPEVMKKAQKEIRSLAGTKDRVEETELHQFTYLKLVVKEVLRFHPPTPLLIPRVTREACTLCGYDIPAETLVFVNALAINRDPKYWVRPDEFWPERFVGSVVDFVGQDFQFIPFGAGRRGCPGMAMGVAMVELTLANLLLRFDWELPGRMSPATLDVEGTDGPVVRKKSPLRLIARPIEKRNP